MLSHTCTNLQIQRTWKVKSEGFRGEKIQVVQIGCGTCRTFIQNLAGRKGEWDGMIHWLLKPVSEKRCRAFKGVAVEPVAEHIVRLRQKKYKGDECLLPHVSLVQVAIGEENIKSDVHVLTRRKHDALIASVPRCRRKELKEKLLYLLNMSSVGGKHPYFDENRWQLWMTFGIDVELEWHRTEVWTYGKLAQAQQFFGCELLVIDAEGHDAAILRSMIKHCKEEEGASDRNAWPDVICFESAGHCDRKEGAATEETIVGKLQECGYAMFAGDSMNTFMVNLRALEQSQRLKTWLDELLCPKCGYRGRCAWPIKSNGRAMTCTACTLAKP